MPQPYGLNVHAKCDLEKESKQALVIWNIGRATNEKEYATKMIN